MPESVSLLEQIQASLDEGNYKATRDLLQQWQKVEPDNPWFHFYVGRWYEQTGKWDQAEECYRKLLKTASIPQVILHTRQGLERLSRREVEARDEAIAQEKAADGGEEYGIFVLEPIPNEARKAAAKHFAEVMQTDVYSARLQLPGRSWRLFRTGAMGELRFYANALQAGDITGFCISLHQLQQLQTLQVQSIEALDPQLIVRCTDSNQQALTLSLDWLEIEQWVTAFLPLFEETIEKGARGKTYNKTKVLDYAQFCDLHVGDRQLILRFCDQHYQFRQGISFLPPVTGKTTIEQNSLRRSWNNLIAALEQHLSHATRWSDFKPFAESAVSFPELLKKITPNVNLFRDEKHQDTHWDPALQLYSSLIFVRSIQHKLDIDLQKN